MLHASKRAACTTVRQQGCGELRPAPLCNGNRVGMLTAAGTGEPSVQASSGGEQRSVMAQCSRCCKARQSTSNANQERAPRSGPVPCVNGRSAGGKALRNLLRTVRCVTNHSRMQ